VARYIFFSKEIQSSKEAEEVKYLRKIYLEQFLDELSKVYDEITGKKYQVLGKKLIEICSD
jgi:hypothetical protein